LRSKTEPKTNAILFLDEQLASMPASGIPEDFRKLPHFFSVIVLLPKSAVDNEATQKKLAPNKSVTDFNDTRNVCLPSRKNIKDAALQGIPASRRRVETLSKSAHGRSFDSS
jgi:hypothetical protein